MATARAPRRERGNPPAPRVLWGLHNRRHHHLLLLHHELKVLKAQGAPGEADSAGFADAPTALALETRQLDSNLQRRYTEGRNL